MCKSKIKLRHFITIYADGWYGIAVKRVDEASFDFSIDSINVSDYVELVIK